MRFSFTTLKKLPVRTRGSALGVLVVIVIAIQVFRFIRLGPELAEVSAATMSETAEKVVTTLPRDTSDLNEYRDLMMHTQQVTEKFQSLATQPSQPRTLAVNPFRIARTPPLSDDRTTQERTETREAAQALELQSVMPSKVAPVCIINNILLREGQPVDGFTVETINPNSVVVHRDGYRFELRLIR